MRRLVIAAAVSACSVTQAFASGFQIPEMGIKAMGMANAFTAVADDPTANWYNPAGIAFQESSALTLGGTVVMPKVDFASNSSNPLHPTAPTSVDRKPMLVPHAYWRNSIEGSKLSYGIGINSPFGLEVKWPTTAPFAAATQYGRLQSVQVNPNIAVRINDALSLAAGIDYAYMKVDFNGTALLQNFTGDGWGFNVAALYKSDAFNVGISYRSSIRIKASGQSTLVAAATTVSNRITVTEPDLLNIGVAFHPARQWTIDAEAGWTNWKQFDKLAFSYAPALPVYGSSLTVPENWKSGWTWRIGAEWAYSPTMRARLGYTYDPTPIKAADYTPLIPSNDRQAFHLGYGVDLSDAATLDLGYVYVWIKTRNQTQSTGTNAVRNGTYKGSIQLASASLTFRF